MRTPIRSASVLLAALTSWLLGSTAAVAATDIETRFVPAVEHEQAGGTELRISTVSTRNDMVSGGDVLVRIAADDGVDLAALRVALNDADVTSAFQPAAEGHALEGLVEGLVDGDNAIKVTGAAGLEATLTVTNYPITGPILAGPHETPFVCTTDVHEIELLGGTLGPALDEDCSIATRVDYFYRSSDGNFNALPDPAARPQDLATTTTATGATVPYIVRVETGTINRSIYNMAILHDPAADGEPSPFNQPEGWNQRLIYFFGGGCIGGYYHQGEPDLEAVLHDGWLSQGYAAVHSTLNQFRNNCSDLLSAETTIMIKERFIEAYGPPLFTIGTGSSGGSYQSHQIADAYPGLLDGIIVASSFPDVTSATLFTLADARLLHHYFNDTRPGRYSPWIQRAISGFGVEANITFLGTTGGALRIDPDESHNEVVPAALHYNAETNPTGARSTVYDHTVNVYGRDEETGFALRPLDNVGVQYGLQALNDGEITVAEFLDLNENIGGFDIDLNYQPERTEADLSATKAAYYTGRILSGGGGLNATPIIDTRRYRDAAPGGDIHQIVHQFSTRQRLIAANGDADNHVMLIGGLFGYSEADTDMAIPFEQMDRWLTAIKADTSGAPLPELVRRHRPADLVDACWDREHVKIEEAQSYQGDGVCARLYPHFSTPRHVAGAPLANDIVRCALKPIDWADYRVSFTGEQKARLQAIFADGVCDWSQAGVEQVAVETWLRYAEPVTQ